MPGRWKRDFFVREVGMLERLAKMVHGILSKDVYRATE